jgi:membrane fusion protein, multidrug efflux system
MEQTQEPKNNRKPIFAGIGILALAVGIYFAYQKISYSLHNEDTENSQIECNIYPIAPRVGGYIEQIRVSDNQLVKKGDTLVVLDYRDLKLKVQQAEINLANALANVDVIKNNVTTASATSGASTANIAAAQANLDVAEVRIWRATQEFDRISKLVALKSATQQQLDNAKAEKESAEKQANAAKMQLAASKDQAGASQSNVSGASKQVKMAEVAILQRQSELDFAKLQLSYAFVTAPCTGFVSKKNIQQGQLVSAGAPLFSIVDDTKLWITANFKETQVRGIKPGQVVSIKVDAFPDKTFEGTVESIQAATGSKFSLIPADNATGNFVKVVQRIPVRIALNDDKNDEFALRAGMNVQVAVKTN